MRTTYARRRFRAAALKRGMDAMDRAYAGATRDLLHPHHSSATCPTYYDGCNCGVITYVKGSVSDLTLEVPEDGEVPDVHLVPARAGRPWWYWKFNDWRHRQ
jgi:hypothetical protein